MDGRAWGGWIYYINIFSHLSPLTLMTQRLHDYKSMDGARPSEPPAPQILHILKIVSKILSLGSLRMSQVTFAAFPLAVSVKGAFVTVCTRATKGTIWCFMLCFIEMFLFI